MSVLDPLKHQLPAEVIDILDDVVSFNSASGNIADTVTANGVSITALKAPTYSDSSGTPGNATANTASGRSAIAGSATACVITNSQVTATSVVMVTLEDADGTATRVKVVPTTNTITVTANAAATGTTKFRWFVVGAV